MLAAVWADAESCQPLTAALHVAGTIFVSLGTDFSYGAADPGVETAGPGAGVPATGAHTGRAACLSYRQMFSAAGVILTPKSVPILEYRKPSEGGGILPGGCRYVPDTLLHERF